jgi:hypothetical protein
LHALRVGKQRIGLLVMASSLFRWLFHQAAALSLSLSTGESSSAERR